ncbi:siderophore-interacting protein [Dactylosporangium sp. NPDC049140]|jgi:NADPH-dependent ferric siderophore reductase|uniref:siderophore-interacting protein n=1 Tax=Dactylosporangium sp. NPDC049140 TaxID=3155647 RepID=UPI0033D34397
MKLWERLFVRAAVVEAEITGRFRRLRLRAGALRDAEWRPGQQVRVDVGPKGAFGPLLRTYSVWSREADTIELQALLHGDGPGARWMAAAEPGDEVLLSRPKGDFVTRPARYHLFVGEETASVAFGPMLRALPAAERAASRVVVEAGPADRLALDGNVTWAPRDGLIDAVRLLDLPPEPGQAYVAGEARAVQAVRQHLVRDRGWPRRSVLTKPFWTPGKRGME